MKLDFEKAKQFFQDKNFVIEDEKLKVILTTIQMGQSILSTGPTGSGKTLFFSLLAEYLGGSYHYQSLNGSITIDDLKQERILGKNGTFEEQDMILAKWLRDSQKGISLLQFDEINAAKPETLLALHPILDIKGELELPYSNEVLKVNSNAIMIMTCNEGDEYIGVNAMNEAFTNRPFIKVPFEYLQGKQLSDLLSLRTGVSTEQTMKVVNVWSKYMSSRDPEQPVISIRVLEYWLELSKTTDLKTAGKYTFATRIAQGEELIELMEGDLWVHLG